MSTVVRRPGPPRPGPPRPGPRSPSAMPAQRSWTGPHRSSRTGWHARTRGGPWCVAPRSLRPCRSRARAGAGRGVHAAGVHVAARAQLDLVRPRDVRDAPAEAAEVADVDRADASLQVRVVREPSPVSVSKSSTAIARWLRSLPSGTGRPRVGRIPDAAAPDPTGAGGTNAPIGTLSRHVVPDCAELHGFAPRLHSSASRR